MTIYNESVIADADKVARAAQRDFFSIRKEGAVTFSAIAGAGKSHFVMDTVKKCRRNGMSVAVAAPTNDQVFKPGSIHRRKRAPTAGRIHSSRGHRATCLGSAPECSQLHSGP